jgi:PII-like signaling protein
MTDCLRLTAYLGERQRTNSRFATDEILDLYTRRQVATSVVLRGIAGFGVRHVLRTDQSLSLSEDPPVVIAAVDTPDVIDMLAGDVTALMPRGLLTLEPAVLLDGPAVQAGSGSVRLTVSLGRNRRIDGVPAFRLVCDLLYRNHFAGASTFVGVDGTAHGERRRARFFSRNLDVPLVVVAVGTAEQAQAVLPALHAALEDPLITVEPEQLCKRSGTLLAHPEVLPPNSTAWQKLMVQTSESTLHDGVPIHRALIRRLRQSRSANGATVLRGIWGFHGDHAPNGDELIQFGRQVPVTTVIVDTADNIRRSFAIADELTAEHGLVSCQSVPARVILGEHHR